MLQHRDPVGRYMTSPRRHAVVGLLRVRECAKVDVLVCAVFLACEVCCTVLMFATVCCVVKVLVGVGMGGPRGRLRDPKEVWGRRRVASSCLSNPWPALLAVTFNLVAFDLNLPL